MEVGKAYVTIGTSTETLKRGLRDAEGATDKSMREMEHSTGSGIANLKQHWLAYTAVITGAIYAINKVTSAFIQAASVQETAEKRMESALRSTDRYTRTAQESLLRLAAGLQKVTTYGDEVTLSAMAMGQSLASLSTDQLARLTPAVMDLATGLGIDLTNAFSLVGKAFSSSTNPLVRYGIVLDMTKDKAARLDEIVSVIGAKFGGQAAAMVDTYAGRVAQLSNAWGDLKEAIGAAIIKNEAFLKVLERMTALIEVTTGKVAAATQPGGAFAVPPALPERLPYALPADMRAELEKRVEAQLQSEARSGRMLSDIGALPADYKARIARINEWRAARTMQILEETLSAGWRGIGQKGVEPAMPGFEARGGILGTTYTGKPVSATREIVRGQDLIPPEPPREAVDSWTMKFGRVFGDSLHDAIMSEVMPGWEDAWESLFGRANSMTERFASTLGKTVLSMGVTGLAGGIVGALFGGTTFLGGARAALGFKSAQHGGVFSSPDITRIAEGGPEAVIPLQRGSVPVQIVGGGGGVSFDFRGATFMDRYQLRAYLDAAAKSAILRDYAEGGDMRSLIGAGA